jgi:antitoxin StbD
MQRILAEMTTTISEFKKNPNLEVRKAGDKPFAVLTNNKPSFYVLTPERYEALCELAWESSIAPTLKERVADLDSAVAVDIDSL